ncbi:MAG: YidC/Oxa1 family membrane protein insertase [Patescibacteria group bacterium]|nr:YidC/Oxa1 family membrane protein insertase [Patescibacteria group bacterium]
MTSIKYVLKLILYKPLFNALIFLVWLMPYHNVGLAIIILTIIIRLILLPSSMKATRQQKRMRDLQPEITALQEKYKDDKQKQSQELMAFYKKNNVNPLGSCLPLLIQLPILLVLYYVFINGLSTSRFDLLYQFTPRPEFINTWFLGLDLAKPDKFILPVIAGVLQYFQSRQLTPPSTGEKGQEMQAMIGKQMMYLMPLFTVIIAGRLPAALPLYWAVTTLFAVVQQWWVFRSPNGISKSKFQISKKTKEIPATTKKRGVEVTVRKKK